MPYLDLDQDDPNHSTITPDPSSSSLSPITTSPPTLTPTSTSTSTLTTSTTCTLSNCPTSSLSCPTCEDGYICSLSVIGSTCQCPVASCVKPGFDTGSNDGSNGLGSNSTSKRSVLGPVLGSIAGLIIVIVLAFFIARYWRQRRRLKGDRLLGQEEQTDGPVDSPNNSDKRSNHNGQSWSGRSNEIRIAYIPNIPHAEPLQLPELVHLGGGPHASFLDEDYDKHVSVASSFSTGILDEAVVMAMNTKATPKVMRLNAIKADNSELIQRSNSLHKSNSIRRTQSQRKAAVNKVKVEVDHNRGATGDSPDEKTPGGDHEHAQQDQQQYTPAVMVTGPSVRSSTQSVTSTKRKSRPAHMVLEPRPLHPSYHISQSPSTSKSLQNEVQTAVASEPSTKVATPPSTSTAVASVITSATNASQPPTSASSTRTLPAGDQDYRKHSAKIFESDGRRATWSANNKTANSNTSPPPPNTRYSTFSTQSDSRSTTTRGDGEEIMIFWDGHRDSKSSDNI